MRKLLMLLGKILIVFSLLWPVPFGFIMYPLFGEEIGMPMWGISRGYWWPLLSVLALGILLCLVSRYKSPTFEQIQKARFKETILARAFKFLEWGTLLIIGFFLVTLIILALYYLFFTPMLTISVPVCAAIGIVGFLIYVGCQHYNNNKNN